MRGAAPQLSSAERKLTSVLSSAQVLQRTAATATALLSSPAAAAAEHALQPSGQLPVDTHYQLALPRRAGQPCSYGPVLLCPSAAEQCAIASAACPGCCRRRSCFPCSPAALAAAGPL